MKRFLAMMLAAAFGQPVFADDPPMKTVPDKPPETKKDDEKKPETREERLTAINKDMSAERAKLVKEYYAEEDKTAKDKLRAKIIGLPDAYALKAVAIAEENPKDETGFQAIQLAISIGQDGEASKKATQLLIAHHVENPKIADSIIELGRKPSSDMTSFLKAILARNPDRDAKGRAAFRLAQSLADQIENTESDDTVKKLELEAMAMLKRIGDEFSDVTYMKLSANSKADPQLLGKIAAKNVKGISNIKNLRVGKTAPEIEGPDMEDKTFKLSDYRGKVVMLDFWGHW
jgi:hypothetical protein